MEPHLRHLDDFHFAERCLAKDREAIDELEKRFAAAVVPFLVRSGALPDEATELCKGLLTDLVMPAHDRKPRLVCYQGLSALDTWLRTVALNAYLDRKRKEQFERNLMPATVTPSKSAHGDDSEPAWTQDPNPQKRSDQPLLDLMVQAIEMAFQRCPPEDFVLLQLTHCDELHRAELGLMFRCDRTQITRRLTAAQKAIADFVMEHIRQTDPWLELQWEDFTELCRTTNPACFGFE